VFDLSVSPHHCYLANGLLVSNSNYADAFQVLAVGMKRAMGMGDNGLVEDEVAGFGSQFDDDRPIAQGWEADAEVF